MRQRVVLIAGPTASGKSQAAVRVAEQIGGVVVNADSMQVYRDLRLISARPCAADEARVPHHLFGHVDAAERYSVGRWLEDAKPLLTASMKRGLPVVLAGGTGLYFKALTEGLSVMPDVPRRVSGHWERVLKEEGPWTLHAVLMARDPEAADRLDPNDGQRIVRALAVHEVSGKSINQLQSVSGRPLVEARDIVRRLVIMPEREELYRRIDARFDAMIEAGALDEVSTLVARGLDPNLPAMKAIGIPELARHLTDELTLAEAVETAKMQSRRYAKRQMTWIRGQMANWDFSETPGAV